MLRLLCKLAQSRQELFEATATLQPAFTAFLQKSSLFCVATHQQDVSKPATCRCISKHMYSVSSFEIEL